MPGDDLDGHGGDAVADRGRVHCPDAANAALERALAATREKLSVVFGVQRNAGDGEGLILAQFAPLVRRGINCAGLTGQTGSMPLAVRRARPAQ